jgi:cytochrome c2
MSFNGGLAMNVRRSFHFGIDWVLEVAGAPVFRNRNAPTQRKPRPFVLSLAAPLALWFGLTCLASNELTSNANAASGAGPSGRTVGSGHPAASMMAQANPQAGDAAHGQALVQGQCAACHKLQQGAGPGIGPDLFGVTERNIAGASDFDYSAALKAHQGTRWSAATLDEFLKGPTVFAPGTRMALPGIASETDRRDIIAYLETLSSGGTTGQGR